MADIFISYAREDRAAAKRLAEVLAASGWTVWWDRELGGGQHVIREIQEALETARCALVLWSRHSVDSDWVIAEAEDARQRGILVPVALDDARPPLVFRPLQTTDLRGWDRDAEAEEAQRLIRDVGERLARTSAPEPEPEPPTPPELPAPEPEPGPAPPTPEAEPGPPAPELESPAHEPRPPMPGAGPSAPLSPWLKWSALAVAVLAVAIFAIWQLSGPGRIEILQFEVIPARVTQGETAQLLWRVSGVRRVTISAEPGVPLKLAAAGELPLEPDETTIFTLRAGPPDRTVEDQVTLRVDPVPAAREPAPRILSFTVEPEFLQAPGRVLLRWRTEHAEMARISGLGDVAVSDSAEVEVTRSRDFLLEVVGPGGDRAQDEISVEVAGERPDDSGFTMAFRISEPLDLDSRRPGPGSDFRLRRTAREDRVLIVPDHNVRLRPVEVGEPPAVCRRGGLGISPTAVRPGSRVCFRTNRGLTLLCEFLQVSEVMEITCQEAPP